MEAFKTVIWIINIFASLAVIGLVLMQHGKGADAGANFGGSGSAQGVFGSGGNANFLTRMTGIAATILFASCLALGYIHTKSNNKIGNLDFSDVQQTSSTPILSSSASAASAINDSTTNTIAIPAAAVTTTAAAAKIASDKPKTEKIETNIKKSDKPSDKKDDKKIENKKNNQKSDKSDKKTTNDKKYK